MKGTEPLHAVLEIVDRILARRRLGQELLDPGVVAGVAQGLVVEMADLALERGRQVGRAAGGEVLLVGDAVDDDRAPLGERRPGGPPAVAQDGGGLHVLGGDPARAPGEAVVARRPGGGGQGADAHLDPVGLVGLLLAAEALVEAVAEHVDVPRGEAGLEEEAARGAPRDLLDLLGLLHVLGEVRVVEVVPAGEPRHAGGLLARQAVEEDVGPRQGLVELAARPL